MQPRFSLIWAGYAGDMLQLPTSTAQQVTTTLQPVELRRRLPALDVLRGFALLGVLVVNVYQSYSFPLGQADARVGHIIELLGTGTFYPIFSLLFGVGFALYLRKGERALPIFRRRMVTLLFIGLAHGYLLWRGDILGSYALAGLILPFMVPWRRAWWGFVVGGWGLTLLLFSPLVDGFPAGSSAAEALLSYGTYGDVVEARLGEYTSRLVSGLVTFGGQLFALFLLGLWVGRDLAGRLSSRRFLSVTLLLSAGVALFPFLLEPRLPPGWGFVLEYLIASPFLGFAYLAALSLCLLTPFGARLLSPLGYVGRMALSNYLGQSLVCTFVYYGYGLGYYGRLGVTAGLWLSLGLFALQVLLSFWWLQYFRYGPAEWVWRSLTYAQPQPLRAT